MNVNFINPELKVQSTLAGPIGQGFDSPVEKVPTAIEHGLGYPPGFGLFGQQVTQGLTNLSFSF